MPLETTDIITSDPLPQAGDFLVYPWLYPGRLCLMVGPTNIGKTTLTLEVLAQLFKGGHLWDRYPAKTIDTVLYLHAEHTLATLQETAKARGDIVPGSIHVVHDFGPNGPALLDSQGRITSLYSDLKDLVLKLKPNLIIAEPISAFIGTSENDNREARAVVYMLANLGALTNAAVLTHHHVGKSAFDPEHIRPEGIATGEARGAMAFEDAAEVVIYLKRARKGTKDSPSNQMTVSTPKSKGFPISPVTLTFDEDTLSYTHVKQPFAERDLIAIYDRMRKYPLESTSDMMNYFASLWQCSLTKVALMMKRASRVGLLPAKDHQEPSH